MLPEWLRRYWALLLGAMLVGFFGYRLWPSNLRRSFDTGALVPGVAVPGSEVDQTKDDQPRRQAPPPPSAPGDIAPDAQPDQPRYELVEIVIPLETKGREDTQPRTLTQDSPEVKAALGAMDIAIYARPDADDATLASEFLAHNQLKFSLHDLGDAMEQERARRLAGPYDGTVIVVDGQVLRGYSNDGIQQLLLSATKKRVLPENAQE